MSTGIGSYFGRLSAAPHLGRNLRDPAMRLDGDWGFRGLDVAALRAADFGFSDLNLAPDTYSLLQASSLASPAPLPAGGLTVTGWREALADPAVASAAGQAGAVADLHSPASFAAEPAEIALSRPVFPDFPSPVARVEARLDAGEDFTADLLGDDILNLDFDQIQGAPSPQPAAEQQELVGPEMLLPSGLELHDAYGTGRGDPEAGVGFAALDVGSIFESSAPGVYEAAEFVAFDTSLPTPIVASIEWGG